MQRRWEHTEIRFIESSNAAGLRWKRTQRQQGSRHYKKGKIMKLEDALKQNPYDKTRGSKGAYIRYLRYTVDWNNDRAQFFIDHHDDFDGATKEWLEFVVNNRRGKGKNSYDLIMGPVANDQLYATIRLYEQGVVTADAAIEMLKTHKLFNQLSFHTVKVIPLLKFTESIEV